MLGVKEPWGDSGAHPGLRIPAGCGMKPQQEGTDMNVLHTATQWPQSKQQPGLQPQRGLPSC